MSNTLKSIFVRPGANELATTPKADGNVAGFWQGLWNGFTAPVTFLISLFNTDVGVYEAHNNGGWYNFGYIIGLSMIFGGGKGGENWAKTVIGNNPLNIFHVKAQRPQSIIDKGFW